MKKLLFIGLFISSMGLIASEDKTESEKQAAIQKIRDARGEAHSGMDKAIAKAQEEAQKRKELEEAMAGQVAESEKISTEASKEAAESRLAKHRKVLADNVKRRLDRAKGALHGAGEIVRHAGSSAAEKVRNSLARRGGLGGEVAIAGEISSEIAKETVQTNAVADDLDARIARLIAKYGDNHRGLKNALKAAAALGFAAGAGFTAYALQHPEEAKELVAQHSENLAALLNDLVDKAGKKLHDVPVDDWVETARIAGEYSLNQLHSLLERYWHSAPALADASPEDLELEKLIQDL